MLSRQGRSAMHRALCWAPSRPQLGAPKALGCAGPGGGAAVPMNVLATPRLEQLALWPINVVVTSYSLQRAAGRLPLGTAVCTLVAQGRAGAFSNEQQQNVALSASARTAADRCPSPQPSACEQLCRVPAARGAKPAQWAGHASLPVAASPGTGRARPAFAIGSGSR